MSNSGKACLGDTTPNAIPFGYKKPLRKKNANVFFFANALSCLSIKTATCHAAINTIKSKNICYNYFFCWRTPMSLICHRIPFCKICPPCRRNYTPPCPLILNLVHHVAEHPFCPPIFHKNILFYLYILICYNANGNFILFVPLHPFCPPIASFLSPDRILFVPRSHPFCPPITSLLSPDHILFVPRCLQNILIFNVFLAL